MIFLDVCFMLVCQFAKIVAVTLNLLIKELLEIVDERGPYGSVRLQSQQFRKNKRPEELYQILETPAASRVAQPPLMPA